MSWAGGDWLCGACHHTNFKKREACQRCGYPKLGGPDVSAYLKARGTEALAGDWFCAAVSCGAHNYASRTNCYRCGAWKPDHFAGAHNAAGGYANDPGLFPGWKTGDWICSRIGCGVHNYARRTECFRCKAPKDLGGA